MSISSDRALFPGGPTTSFVSAASHATLYDVLRAWATAEAGLRHPITLASPGELRGAISAVSHPRVSGWSRFVANVNAHLVSAMADDSESRDFHRPPYSHQLHNPDNLTPEQVGTGFRLLLESEVDESIHWVEGSRYWGSHGWNSEGCRWVWDSSSTISVPFPQYPWPPNTPNAVINTALLHNPAGLTDEQVGEGYRLLLREEVDGRYATTSRNDDSCQLWNRDHWANNVAGNEAEYTYRIKLSRAPWPAHAYVSENGAGATPLVSSVEKAMTTLKKGERIFGVHPPPDIIVGLPEGVKYRVRIRNDSFAKVYLRTKDGVSEWFPKYLDTVKNEAGEDKVRWVLSICKGTNYHSDTKTDAENAGGLELPRWKRKRRLLRNN